MADRIDLLSELLAKVPLFNGISASALRSLAEVCRVRRYGKRDVIFQEGDPGNGLFLVVTGTVTVTTLDGQGETTHIADRGPGEHIGELALFDGRRRSATVTAISDVEMLYLDREAFFGVSEKVPAITRNVIFELANRLREEIDRRKREKSADAQQRLCAVLLELANGEPARVSLRQSELGERVGATRETVSRCLRVLKSAGAVKMAGRDILILNAGKLQQMAESA
jgi:CRP-like cAMP-binding protein